MMDSQMELLELFSDWDDQVELPKGAVIFKRGDPADYLYVVTEGEVELRVGDEPLAAELAGGIFGEMALVQSLRAADAFTLRPTRLARVSREQFRELVRKDPDLAIHLISVVANRLQVAVTMAGM
jgi:CRP-like cAMP-binding protein